MALLLAHAAVTWALVGLIWTIQRVHYPLFRHVQPEQWEAFHHEHARRITELVAVLMPAEALLAAWLLLRDPSAWTGVGAALVLLVWLSTAFLQMPLHQRLAEGYEPRAGGSLVATNWIRTLAWTARGVIALVLLAHA